MPINLCAAADERPMCGLVQVERRFNTMDLAGLFPSMNLNEDELNELEEADVERHGVLLVTVMEP
jgi:hypothetical protein